MPLVITVLIPQTAEVVAEQVCLPHSPSLAVPSASSLGADLAYYVFSCSPSDSGSDVHVFRGARSLDDIKSRLSEFEPEYVATVEDGKRFVLGLRSLTLGGPYEVHLRHVQLETESYSCPICGDDLGLLALTAHLMFAHSTTLWAYLPGGSLAIVGSLARLFKPILASPELDPSIGRYLRWLLNRLWNAQSVARYY